MAGQEDIWSVEVVDSPGVLCYLHIPLLPHVRTSATRDTKRDRPCCVPSLIKSNDNRLTIIHALLYHTAFVLAYAEALYLQFTAHGSLQQSLSPRIEKKPHSISSNARTIYVSP
jgi:hypothetical protein